MPNQRSKNKAYIGGYIDKALHEEIKQLAREDGMEHNKFGFVEKLIREALARWKERPARPGVISRIGGRNAHDRPEFSLRGCGISKSLRQLAGRHIPPPRRSPAGCGGDQSSL